MSREYAESRIREALESCKGNATKARQRIIAQLADDHKLLMALARPHLTGIVSHAVNRVVSRSEIEDSPPPEQPKTLDMPPQTFGQEILQALQGNKSATFGLENDLPGRRRGQASKNHIEAMKRIARKHDDDKKI